MTAGVDLYEDFQTLQTPCAGGINHWVADVGQESCESGGDGWSWG